MLLVLEKLLGLQPNTREDVPSEGVRVHFLRAGTAKLELLERVGIADSPIRRFLERRGEGLHHVAFEVDDLEAHMKRMRTLGLRPISDKPRRGAGGMSVYFLHPGDTHGVLFEFCQHAAPTPVYIVGNDTAPTGDLSFSSRYKPLPLAQGADLPTTEGRNHIVGIQEGFSWAVDLAHRCPNSVRTLTACNPARNAPAYHGQCPVLVVSLQGATTAALDLHRAIPSSDLCVLPAGGAALSRVLEEHFSSTR